MFQSNRRHLLINKEEIINYEFEILEQSTPLAKPTFFNSNKYSIWDLDSKIKEVVGDNAHSIRWIGNSETAYLQTYAYIMLVAASHSQANILQFKHIIYKFGRECLNLPEQKLLVEFLCLIEYSRDRYAFLNKYPQIQALLIKILQYVEDDSPPSEDSALEKHKAKVRRKTNGKTLERLLQKKDQHPDPTSRSKNSQSQQTQYQKQLEEIYSEFNKYFQFISLLGSNQYSCSLKLFETKKIFVIIEKDCYFMVQVSDKNPNSFLQFTLGNKLLSQNTKNEIQEEIRAEIKAFDQKAQFNQQQLNEIMDYHNQLQESKVISIQRASQIRTPLNSLFTFLDIKKNFNQISSELKQSYEQTIIDKSENEFDNTLINELIKNSALNAEKEVSKQQSVTSESRLPAHILNKKQKIMQKMKQFKKMKEAIQIVRERIEGKLKKIEQAQHFKTEISPKIGEKRQPQNQISPTHRKDEQLTHLFNQASVKFKLQAMASRKNSLNTPTSLQCIPEPKNVEQFVMNHKTEQIQPEDTSLMNAKYVPEQDYSRAESKLRSPQNQRSASPKFRTMIPRKGSLDVALVQPLSPNNLNVNVNVSINENLMNPRYTSPSSSILKQTLQKYVSNKQTNQSPHWYPPNYKKHPRPLNLYGYKANSLEKATNNAGHLWNAAKSTGFYTRK